MVAEKAGKSAEPNVLEMAALLDSLQSQGLLPRGSVAASGSAVDALVANKSAPGRSEMDSAFAASAALALPVEVLGVNMGNRVSDDSKRDAAAPILGSADLLSFLGGLRGEAIGAAVEDPRNEFTFGMSASDSGAFDTMVGQHQSPDLVVKGATPEAALIMNSAVVAAPTQTADLRNQWELATVAQELARNGGGTVRLKVRPEGLGEITMSVTQGAGKGGRKELALQIVAETAQARELLLQGMPGLNQVLKSKDYDLKAFDVAVQDGVSAAFAAAVVERLSGASAGMSGSDFTSARDGGGQRQQQEQGQGNAWERYEQQAQNREQRGGRRPWETWLAS
jgi:hypothetical protein